MIKNSDNSIEEMIGAMYPDSAPLDYSPGSLATVDAMLAEASKTFGQVGKMMVGAFAGKYYGEVLRRTLGGEWRTENGERMIFIDEDHKLYPYSTIRARVSDPEKPPLRKVYQALKAMCDGAELPSDVVVEAK